MLLLQFNAVLSCHFHVRALHGRCAEPFCARRYQKEQLQAELNDVVEQGRKEDDTRSKLQARSITSHLPCPLLCA
jgi:hypothetical protein